MSLTVIGVVAVGDGVHDRLPDRLQRVLPTLLPASAGIDPCLQANVPPHELQRAFDDAAVDPLDALGERSRLPGVARSVRLRALERERHRRRPHRGPLLGVVVLPDPRVGRRADARVREIAIGVPSEQEQSGRTRHGAAAALDHDFRVDQQMGPGPLVPDFGKVLLPQIAKVVDQPAPIEVGKRRAGDRLAIVLHQVLAKGSSICDERIGSGAAS